jgi:hypothetical protein
MTRQSKKDKVLEDIVTNINADRAKAAELLSTAGNYIGQSEERLKDVGMAAAKYVEALQRSNEQLIKVAELMRKSGAGEEDDISADSIYEQFEDENQKSKDKENDE